MSHSRTVSPRWILVRNVLLVAAAAIGLRASVEFMREFGRLDPFSSAYKPEEPTPDMPSGAGILLEDVTLRHYKGKQLQTNAQVQQVAIRRDRQFFDLKGIVEGTYRSEKGPVTFSAREGTWDSMLGVLEARGNARVKAKDFDLRSNRAILNQKQAILKVPTPLKGSLLKGEVTAGSLTLKLNKTNDILAKNVKWAGKAAWNVQDDAQEGPRKWTILSMASVETKGDLVIYQEGEITDGDVIVQAKLIEHNRKSDVITATGKVSYFSGAADMTSDKAVVYRKEKRANFTGNVTMLVRPKDKRDEKPKIQPIEPFRPALPDEIKAKQPKVRTDPVEKQRDEDLRDPKTIRTYPMFVRSESITYWYRQGGRRAEISGQPQARQDLPGGRWRHVWATTAKWDGEKELLSMFSADDKIDVRMKNSFADDLVAKVVILSTKENDDSFSAVQPKGDIYSTDEEIPRDGSNNTTAAGAGGTGAGGTGGGTGGAGGTGGTGGSSEPPPAIK